MTAHTYVVLHTYVVFLKHLSIDRVIQASKRASEREREISSPLLSSDDVKRSFSTDV